MTIGNIIVGICVIALIIWDIRYLLKHGVEECGGECSNCGQGCKWVNDVEKARRHIAFKNKLKKILHIS